MSSKGQVVIPFNIRKRMNLEEGEKFIVVDSPNTIILKKLEKPSKEEFLKEFNRIAKEGEKRANALGIKESDVPKIIHKFRGIKE